MARRRPKKTEDDSIERCHAMEWAPIKHVDFDTPIICPVIRANGESHMLEEMWSDGEYPELKAVGYARLGAGSQPSWVSYTITTKGSEVIKIEIGEPDIRAIADETCKIAYVNTFTDQE